MGTAAGAAAGSRGCVGPVCRICCKSISCARSVLGLRKHERTLRQTMKMTTKAPMPMSTRWRMLKPMKVNGLT